ncbi:hypothetical protein NDU88_010413 [Pleurodeles waltl]|uniref:Uncharacterized protein n=1 Tax=Pleurodeles waltl TaxID=8319 RepID=A0AAV7PV28_PLEWA|nr:hypothetical protein NDU88_010413 [Pleurodeles waltl]
MLLACSRRKEAGRKPPIGSMRVRTHGQQKRTASSERASARSHGLLPLHIGGKPELHRKKCASHFIARDMLYAKVSEEIRPL